MAYYFCVVESREGMRVGLALRHEGDPREAGLKGVTLISCKRCISAADAEKERRRWARKNCLMPVTLTERRKEPTTTGRTWPFTS